MRAGRWAGSRKRRAPVFNRIGIALSIAAAGAACAGPASLPPDPFENPGFQHFYNLEYDQALAVFMGQSAKEPDSADIHNHIAQVILFRQMFRSGALGSDLVSSANAFLKRPKMPMSAADDAQLNREVSKAIEIAEARLKQDPKDTSALYSLGVSHGIRANYEFMEKKWIDALKDASAARKLHNRILEIDPNMEDARLIPGLDEYVVGSLPWGYKMITSVAGFSGDRNKGIEMLKRVAAGGRYNRFDADALLAAIYRREKRPAEAIAPLEKMIGKFPRSYILRIELAEMYGDMGDRDKALAAVGQLDQLRHNGAPGYAQLPEGLIHSTRGGVLMQLHDLDGALAEMKLATAGANKMDAPSAGVAWVRLGQIYDLKGQRQQAIGAYQEAMRAAPVTEAFEDAKRYSASRYKESA